jgi:GMP synthase PP-ATPase subunit
MIHQALDTLRKADAIYFDEIRRAGLYGAIAEYSPRTSPILCEAVR